MTEVKLYKIEADYANRARHPRYYVLERDKRKAKKKFKETFTWLKIYNIEEMTDPEEVHYIVQHPFEYLVFKWVEDRVVELCLAQNSRRHDMEIFRKNNVQFSQVLEGDAFKYCGNMYIKTAELWWRGEGCTDYYKRNAVSLIDGRAINVDEDTAVGILDAKIVV